MADRYWVGGTGTWNTTSTANWSASSGGPSGASVPTTADNVIFDQAATYTVTMTGALNCLDITVSAGVVTFATGTIPTLTVTGSWSTIAGTVWNSTGTVTFTSTTTRTITSGGITINAPFTFNGTGGTWTLQDNLTLANTLTTTLTTGTLALGSFTLTTGLFASSGTVARTINFGTGSIILTTSSSTTIWNTSTTTNLTISGTPLVITQTSAAATKTINTGALSESNSISFQLNDTSGPIQFTSGNTVKNLTIDGSFTLNGVPITIYGNYTQISGTVAISAEPLTFAATSGTKTISSVSTIGRPIIINGTTATYQLTSSITIASTITMNSGTFDGNSQSLSVNSFNIGGSINLKNINSSSSFVQNSGTTTLETNSTTGTYSLNAGTLLLVSYTLTCAGFISNNSNSRTLNFGTGKIILSRSTAATIWNVNNITNLTIAGTRTVEVTGGGGSAVTKVITVASSTVDLAESTTVDFILKDTEGTIINFNASNSTVRSLELRAGSGGQTLSFSIGGGTFRICGNFIHDNTIASTTSTFFPSLTALELAASSGSWTVSVNSFGTFNIPFNIGDSRNVTPTATWTLASNITMGVTHTTTFRNGTLALGTNTLTTGAFDSNGTGLRTLNFGTGKIVLNRNTAATIWTTATTTNLTVSGTSLVECIGGGTAITKTINTGALSEANAISFSFLETSGTVTYAFTAGNVVRNLITNGLQTVSNIAILIYGNFTHQTTNGTTTFTAGTNAWTFAATSGSYTINNIAGFTYDFPWTFGSATSTATWTLVNNLTLGATRQLTLTNGTTDFNSKTLSAAGITILTGTPTIANTGTASFTTSLPITHTSGSLTLSFDFTTTSATGYTLTAGTLALGTFTLTTRVFSSSGTGVRTLNFGTGKIVLNTSVTSTIWNTGTITSLTVSGTNPLVECIGGGSVTKTINTGALSEANAISFSFLETTGSATYTFTVGNSFRNLLFNGVQTISNIAISIFGGFTHLNTNGTTTFTAGASSWQFLATSGSYNITPLAGATYDFGISIGATTAGTATWTLQNNLTIGSTRSIIFNSGTIDLNNRTLSGPSNAISISPIAGATFTLNNTGGTTFNAVGITHNSGTFNLGTNVTLTGPYSFVAGTITLNSFVLTATVFSATIVNTRTINYGTSRIDITGNNTTVLNLVGTITSTGTPYIRSTYTGGVGTRVFTGITFAESSAYSVYTSGTSGIVIGTSATDSVTLSGAYKDVDLTGLTNTITNSVRVIYGNLIIPASGGTITAGALDTAFTGTVLQTITTNGRAVLFPITINKTSTTLRLLDALTLGVSTYATTLTAGTLDLNGFTLSTGLFSSSNSNARTIAFNGGQISISGNAGAPLDIATATSFTWTGTPYFNLTYAGATGTRVISLGSTTQGTFGLGNSFDVSVTGSSGIILGTGTDTINLQGFVNDLNLTGMGFTFLNSSRTIFGNFTVPATGGTINSGSQTTTVVNNSSKTIDVNRSFSNLILGTTGITTGTYVLANNLTVGPGTTGTLTLVSGTLDLNDKSVTALQVTLSSTSTKSINFRTSSVITVNNDSNALWDASTTGGTNFSWTGTARIFASYTGAFSTRRLVFGQTPEQSTFDIVFASTVQANTFTIAPSTDGIDIQGNAKTINYTGTTNIIRGPDASLGRTVFGNYITPSTGGSFDSSGTPITFAGTSGTSTITTNGRISPVPFNINAAGKTIRQLDATILTQPLTLTAGTLDLNNLTFQATRFNSSGAGVRSVLFGTSSQLTLTDNNATIIDISTGTNFSWTGSPKIVSTYASNVGTRAFNIGNTAAIDSAFAFDVNVYGVVSSGINLNASATDSVALTGIYNNVDLRGNISAFSSTLTNTARSIAGAFYTRSTGGTYTSGTAVTTFIGNTSTYIIDTGTRVLDFPFTFQGSATWNIANTFTSGSSTTASARTLTLTSGNVSFGSAQINCGLFSSTNTNNRNLDFGASGRILLLSSATSTLWDTTIGTNFTWTGNFDVDCNFTGAITKTINFGTIAELYAPNVKVATAGTGFGLNTTSATETVALSGNMGNLDLTSFAGTLTNVGRNVFGNLIIPQTGGTYTAGGVATTMAATSGTRTITTNSRTIDFPITVDGIGGTFVANGQIILGGTRSLTLANGTYNQGLNSLTVASMIILGGNVAVSNINLSDLRVTHTSGDLNFSSNIGTGGYTFSAGNLNLNSFQLTCNNFVSTTTTPRAINFGTGRLIVSNSSGGTIWNTSTITNLSTSGSDNVIISSGGTTATTISPGTLSEANSINFSFPAAGSYSLTITSGSTVKTLDFRGPVSGGYVGTLVNGDRTVFGDFITSTGMSLQAGAGTTTFANTSSIQNIITNAKTFDFPVTLNGAGGTVKLLDNLTMGPTRTTTLTAGTLDLNDFVLDTASFSSTNSNIRSIAFANTGRIQLTPSTAVTMWNTAVPTNFSYTGNSNIRTVSTGAVTKTINTGTMSDVQALNWNLNDSAGTVAFTANNAVNNFTINGAFTLSNIPLTIYGDYTYTAATALTAGTNPWTFVGNQNITASGVTHDFPWTFNGTQQFLQSAATIGSTRTTTLTRGLLDLNGYTYSTGAFTVTPGIGAVAPQSVSLDGSNDYLFVPNNSGFNFGSGDFTIECYVNPRTVTDPEGVIASLYSYTNARRSWYIALSNSTLELRYSTDGSLVNTITLNSASGVFTLNAWHHVALVRNGSSLKAYVNGVEVISTTFTGSLYNNTVDNLNIGVVGPTYQNDSEFFGYISNLRIVKGTAVYTSNFAPPLEPLTAIPGTSLLTCQYSTFIDSSVNGHTIIVNGNPSTSIRNPFEYNSVFLNSTASYLSVSGAQTALSFGTGDFAMEGWIYMSVSPATYAAFIDTRPGATGDAYAFGVVNSSGLRLDFFYGGSLRVTSALTMLPNQWYHCAVTRTSGTVRLFINGVRDVNTATVTAAINATASTARIGALTDPFYFTGYISNFRVVKGTSVYTNTFTPSTIPLTTTSQGVTANSVSLLTCQGDTIVDNSNNNFTITTIGTVPVDGLTPFAPITTPNKLLQFDGGTLALTSSGTVFTNTVPTDFNALAGNTKGTITLTNSTAKTFAGNNSNYSAANLNQGGTGTLTVTGNNAFNDISASISSTANSTILFAAGTTTTVNNFTLTGTATNRPLLNSTVESSRAIIFRATTGNTIHSGADYIQCRNIQFSPYANDGTNYLRWWVGANSISLFNNTGALFQNFNANNYVKVYVLETGNSWIVPSDFNISNNTFHLFGGGGGGAGGRGGPAGTRSAGNGGGGGGYTRVTNLYGYTNQNIIYSVGTGGTGGVGTTTAGTGLGTNGTSSLITSWYGNHRANGGTRGSSPGPGAGGTGATFNGGVGGLTLPAGGSSGSGGGGAGGPLGAGGSGGADGTGGGGNGGGTNASSINGGNNNAGVGGGVGAGAAGTFGGGGAGGAGGTPGIPGGAGGDGIDILNSLGGGGGGGGGSRINGLGEGGTPGGNGGRYGGGGGGGQSGSLGIGSNGGSGANGCIIIVYTPATAPRLNNAFLTLF